jgi:hypothetical protein
MPIDIGAGFALMGQSVAQTAQAAALEMIRSEAEERRVKLANDLADARESKGRAETQAFQTSEREAKERFETPERDAKIASQKAQTNQAQTATDIAKDKWWLGSGFAEADLAVRGALSLGSREFSQLTLGLSYRLNAVQVDYGFLMPMGGMTLGNSQGTHRLTFSLRFGQTMADTDYELRMRAAEIAAKKAEEELEQARKESEKLEAELEKLKAETQKKKGEIEETRKTSGRDAALKAASSRFAESMDRYWRRKSEGAGMEERIGILTQILREYAGTGLEMSVAEKELAIAKSDRAKAEVDLAVAWSYYQKIVARGASVPERVELLSHMIERFARTGVDLTNVREELKSLRSRK